MVFPPIIEEKLFSSSFAFVGAPFLNAELLLKAPILFLPVVKIIKMESVEIGSPFSFTVINGDAVVIDPIFSTAEELEAIVALLSTM